MHSWLPQAWWKVTELKPNQTAEFKEFSAELVRSIGPYRGQREIVLEQGRRWPAGEKQGGWRGAESREGYGSKRGDRR